MTVADRIIAFNKNLSYTKALPEGFDVLNPFQNHPETVDAMSRFYRKFYKDQQQRHLILGINPGRHGAGITGIPFTDTKRLEQYAGITMEAHSHEVSSVFVYDMIDAYGGATDFYSDCYINSPFPLALLQEKKPGRWINVNYYDDASLFAQLKDYMVETLRKHIAIGMNQDKVLILGKKNAAYLKPLIEEHQLFQEILVVDHPRYIQQYKFKQRDEYIAQYIHKLDELTGK